MNLGTLKQNLLQHLRAMPQNVVNHSCPTICSCCVKIQHFVLQHRWATHCTCLPARDMLTKALGGCFTIAMNPISCETVAVLVVKMGT